MCMYDVLWAYIKIEDEGRHRKKRRDEKAKSRPGNETAGGIRTKFTCDRPHDVSHVRPHDVFAIR